MKNKFVLVLSCAHAQICVQHDLQMFLNYERFYDGGLNAWYNTEKVQYKSLD